MSNWFDAFTGLNDYETHKKLKNSSQNAVLLWSFELLRDLVTEYDDVVVGIESFLDKAEELELDEDTIRVAVHSLGAELKKEINQLGENPYLEFIYYMYPEDEKARIELDEHIDGILESHFNIEAMKEEGILD